MNFLLSIPALKRDAAYIARVGSQLVCDETSKPVMDCSCGQRHFTDAALRARRDPTRTLDLRRRFIRDLDRRWRAISRLVTEAVATQDMFGLRGSSIRALSIISMSSGRVPAFQSWIDTALADVVLGQDREAWIGDYINEAYRRGWKTAFSQREINAPYHEDRASILTKLTISEIQGINEAFSQRAVRIFSEGLLSHSPPAAIARLIRQAVDSIGIVRSRANVQFMIVRANNEAALDYFETIGQELVGVLPETVPSPGRAHAIRDAKAKKKSKKTKNLVEVLTAGDDNVCPICEDIAENNPYTINEARGLIPAHPNCRCAFVPLEDERFAHDEAIRFFGDYDPGELRDPLGRWSRGGSSPITEAEAIEGAKTHRELMAAIRKKMAAQQKGEAFIGIPGTHAGMDTAYIVVRASDMYIGQRLRDGNEMTLSRDPIALDGSDPLAQLWKVDIRGVAVAFGEASVVVPPGTVFEIDSVEDGVWNVRAW